MGFGGEAGIVGLEMDTGVIRAVELKGKPGKARLVTVGQEEIPESAVIEGAVVDADAVGSGLERLWGKARFGSRNVVAGTFNQGVMMRLVAFPKVPKDKLAQALRLQAGDYFPIPLSQAVLDYAVVGETNGGESGPAYEVLLVAARRTQLDKRLAALKYARLQPVVVDAAPLALMRTLPKEKFNGTVVLLDISNGLSSLLVIAGGVPRFARVIPVTLQQYLVSLGLGLGGADTADMLQVAAAGETNGHALASWGADLAREIRSSVSYVVRQESGADVVVLSGRGARVSGLQQLLREELAMPVEVLQPHNSVAVASTGFNWDAGGHDFAVSIGLALRGLEG